MILAGKSLPMKDRIRTAKNQEEEKLKVIEETAKLWMTIFGEQNIGVEQWEKATKKALTLGNIPRLEVNIINPTLMSVALEQISKDYQAEQSGSRNGAQAADLNRQVKDYLDSVGREESGAMFEAFPEIRVLNEYFRKHFKKPWMPWPDSDFVRKAVGNRYSPETVERNMAHLKCYICFYQHSKRDGVNLPVKLSYNEDGMLRIDLVEKTA